MFGQFLTYLEEHGQGLWVLFVSIVFIAGICNWMAWVFALGRFSSTAPEPPRSNQIRFVIADLFTKIIDDFRHFLALIVVVIFAACLAYAMVHSGRNGDGEAISKAVQGIVASLGGLVGSILGYYFGESAGAKKSETRPNVPAEAVAVQTGSSTPQPGISPVRAPRATPASSSVSTPTPTTP